MTLSSANDLSGAVTIGGTVSNIRDFNLRNTNSSAALPTNLSSLSSLRDLTLTYNNAAIALPALTLQSGGDLAITAGGAITQSGALVVPSTSSFTAGANAITLTNASNDFTGAIALSNSGANNVSVRTLGAMSAGTVSVGTGTLTLNGVGISQADGTTITQAAGAGAVTITGNAGAITLTKSNSFTGAIGLSNSGANNIGLTSSNALDIATSAVGSGAFSLISGGSITQSGTITQAVSAGTFTLESTAANSDITLSLANDLNGTISLGGTLGNILDVNLRNVNTSASLITNLGSASSLRNLTLAFNNAAIALGALSMTGNLDVTAGGAITQSGALTISGTDKTATFAAGSSNNLTLSNSGNNFTKVLITSGNNVTLVDTNALNLGASTVSGNLSVTTSGAITVSGALSMNGSSKTAEFVSNGNDMTFSATVDGTAAFTLNPGAAGNITFDANLGNTTALSSLVISNGTNITNNATITTGDFTQSAGSGLSALGGSTLVATGTATITTNNTTGRVTVGALELDTNAANLTGTVNGFAGQTGADSIVLLNTIGQGTHFFNGIDLYKSTPSSSSSSTTAASTTTTTTNPALVFLPFLAEDAEEEEEDYLLNVQKSRKKNIIPCFFKTCNVDSVGLSQSSR